MSGVDFHQHVWPDAVRRVLERRSEPPHIRAGRLVLPTGGTFDLDASAYSPVARLAELDRNALDRAVVSLPPTTEPTPDLIEAWHDAAPQLERDSDGRLVPLAYAAALPGFVGAIVPASQFASPADGRLLLRRLSERGQFAFVHPGGCPQSDPPWWTPGIAYTHQMLQAYGSWLGGGVQQFPELRVVFALLGGGAAFQVERFIRRGLDARAPFGTNTWFETSSYGERALGMSLQTFGAARLVFGSDAPVDTVADARAALEGFGAALGREVLQSNPLALLSAKRHRWAA